MEAAVNAVASFFALNASKWEDSHNLKELNLVSLGDILCQPLFFSFQLV